MNIVTKESLAQRIAELESAVYRSLKEEFQLSALRELRDRQDADSKGLTWAQWCDAEDKL